MDAQLCNSVFDRAIEDYHKTDSVDHPMTNPFPAEKVEALLYQKSWIDTVQWHLEDIIRSPDIAPDRLVGIKRRIDKSNQDRTDTVEKIDDVFLAMFHGIEKKPGARMNSETPAWLVDRMAILALKVYHMREQTGRTDVDESHREACRRKLAILLEQRGDLARCLDELIADIRAGTRYMKVYRQMKMYNDSTLNPVLYGTQPKA